MIGEVREVLGCISAGLVRAFVLLMSIVNLLMGNIAQGIPDLFGTRIIQLFFFLESPRAACW